MEAQGYHCSLVVHLMGLLCNADVLTVEQALQHPAVKIISVSIPKFVTGFEKRGHFNHVFFERTHVFNLLPFIQIWYHGSKI